MGCRASLAMTRFVTASVARQSRARIRSHGLPRCARKDGGYGLPRCARKDGGYGLPRFARNDAGGVQGWQKVRSSNVTPVEL